MHPSHDVLALLALGEQAGTPDDRAHVDGCTSCTSEVAEFARLTDLGRGVQPGPLEVPPAYVWDRITDELGLSGLPNPRSAGVAHQSAPVRALEPRRPRRRRGAVVVAVAAVLALIVGIGAGIGIDRYRATHQQTVVAEATLNGLPGWTSATGRATVEVDRQGERQLVVTMTGPPIQNALTEAWLAKPDLSGMVALGQMDDGSGRFSLPSGIDLAEYSVVDVSKEPLDGNVAHSQDSIVRGRLS